MTERFCFVVMGFGKKIDYAKRPRTLDLDKTYTGLIKPAVVACGLRCIRSDEVKQSGIIDQRMYEMLLRADLVIADISTANPNALYELGVRHALRPFSTIVIKEIDGKFLFDLNHLATLQYKHLGEDIGVSEAQEKGTQLRELITKVMSESETDSPVYTFLKDLQRPMMSDAELDRLVRKVDDASGAGCAETVAAGRVAADASDHKKARDLFRKALDLQARAGGAEAVEPFIVQQLALHTYKATEPTPLEALQAARAIIDGLDPEESTDLETLGIAGAIRKNLYKQEPHRAHIEAAIDHYGRGFELKRDYYNGENYALCLDIRARIQTDASEARYDRMTARKVRERTRTHLAEALAEPTVDQRADYRWMLATMANTAYALGDPTAGSDYEARFRARNQAAWEVQTFEEGKRYASEIAALGT